VEEEEEEKRRRRRACRLAGKAGTPFHLKLLLEEQCTVLGLDQKSVNTSVPQSRGRAQRSRLHDVSLDVEL